LINKYFCINIATLDTAYYPYNEGILGISPILSDNIEGNIVKNSKLIFIIPSSDIKTGNKEIAEQNKKKKMIISNYIK
jgi:hypothetical protein